MNRKIFFLSSIAVGENEVSFKYKDYADESKQKTMTLEATEFLRRFCLHLLPRGFRKIRYYGFMANVHSALLQVQQQEKGIVVQTNTHCMIGEGKCEAKKISWKVIAKQKLNYDADQCPSCKKGMMVTLFHFNANASPDMQSMQLLAELIKRKTA